EWVALLNLFPDYVKESLIPALEVTNQRLAFNFSRLKFSPGGSRNVQQELDALAGTEGQLRFLDAFLKPLAAGFTATLNRALPSTNDPVNFPQGLFQAESFGGFLGLQPPGDIEGFNRLKKALGTFIGTQS